MNYEVAAQQAAIPAVSRFACNMNGIAPEERVRYGQLVKSLRSSILGRSELSDGFTFEMNVKQMSTDHLAEWIELERKCCPFFGFEIRWAAESGPVRLHLSRPEGVKEFILDEFGLR